MEITHGHKFNQACKNTLPMNGVGTCNAMNKCAHSTCGMCKLKASYAALLSGGTKK